MDSGFWTGILVAALIGVPFNIMSNLWTEPLRRYISQRRTIRLNSQKDKELADYALALALSKGQPLAILTLEGERSLAARLLSYGVLCMVLSAAFVTLAVAFMNTEKLLLFAGACAIITAVAAGVAAKSSNSAALHADNLVSKAQNLQGYEDEIRAKWGADTLTAASHDKP